MNGYEEDESDGLVQSTFTIPCSTSSQSTQGAFPVLSKYERTAGPSKLRRRGFNSARKRVLQAYENALSSIFDSVIAEVEFLCTQSQPGVPSYFIPGSSSGGTAKRISVASLVGPQTSRYFHDQLRDTLRKQKRCRWAELRPRDCVSLAATVRLLVANLMEQDVSSDSIATGLSSLGCLPANTTAVISLRSIALHKYSILNDLIKAIHSAAQAENFPRVVILLGVEGGLGSLNDKVDSESIRLMDMHRIALPLPSTVFDTMMQELFFVSDVTTSIWLGPSVLELLRYQYYERGFDLDKFLSTVELAIHHHFTTRPLSALAALSPSDYDCADWEPVFFDRLRLHVVEADSQGNINLPQPDTDKTTSKQQHLRNLLTDDFALLASMPDFSSASATYRLNLRRGIRLLHSLRSSFLSQASVDTNDSLLEPRRTRLGGLAWHVLSGQGVNQLTSAVVGAMKKASLRQLREALAEIQSSDWIEEDTVFQQRLDLLMIEVRAGADREKQDETEMEMDLNEVQRVHLVQRRLLREESSDAIKKTVASWTRVNIESWASSRPVLPQIWTYDHSSFLTQLCDPSPRGTILAALNDPTSINVEGGNIPDICRLYQVYQSAGKMINLFDLYQAFSQSVQATSSSTKKRRKGDENEAEVMQRKDAVQARFALAVNEMGKMGFMKKTRRKTDHVLKIVHDLPSTVR